jgi:hypothetical protein
MIHIYTHIVQEVDKYECVWGCFSWLNKYWKKFAECRSWYELNVMEIQIQLVNNPFDFCFV